MTKDIRLFINGQEVEFKQTPAILYNWTETDFTNPTVTMNSYTANITVEGTPKNDQIFGSYWNLERYTTPGEGFNPSYRVPFTLYVNGDVYQKGYVKLQKVNVKGAITTYEISLFGGLGQFLYNLSTDWNTGEKKSLADLHYYSGWNGIEPDEEIELGFTINKDTVLNAWNAIPTHKSTGAHWGQINFAPCYNGLNDKMSNDKAIINFNGIDTNVYKRLNGAYLVPSDGFELGTLPEPLTEWETKDLRCWAQRPIVSAKAILKAIQRKENNQGRYDTGYDVELDPEFFNADNPYYEEAWMTLPLISSMEFNTEAGETSSYTADWASVYYTTSSGYRNNHTYVYNLNNAVSEYGVKVKMKFDLYVNVPNATEDKLYSSYIYMQNLFTYRNRSTVIGLQLFASDSSNRGGNVLDGSDVQWLGLGVTSGSEVVNMPAYKDCVSKGVYTPVYNNASVNSIEGYFEKVSNGVYKWSKQLEVTCSLPVGTTCFKINLQRCGINNDSYSNTASWVYTLANNTLYSPYISGYPSSPVTYSYDFDITTKTVFSNKVITITRLGTNNFFTGREITKQMLLSTDYSPADWLMNYCKMFGLYIHKDAFEDKIYIDTRKTFYHRNVVKNLEDYIDYSQDLDISPIMVDSGFYSMANEAVEGGAYEDYKNVYGKEYGCKIIDTGYEFNADTKELIDSPFKNAVQVRDNGSYYFRPSSGGCPSFSFNGVSYALQRNGIRNNDDIKEMVTQTVDITTVCQPYQAAYPYFDLFDKPEFCKADKSPEEGSNVFLFRYPNYIGVDNLGYFLSDDLDIMAQLNNNPCWIITNSENPSGSTSETIVRKLTTIPKFSRYYCASSKVKAQFAFDWGSPRQLYVPELYFTEDMTLYKQFYGSYLEDSYDINTKILECYVKTDKVLNEDDLRNFYWFRNGLWRLNRLSDYNVVDHKPVKCEFVKVQDLQDMTNMIPDRKTTILRAEAEELAIDWVGGTVYVTVTTNNGNGYQVTDYTSGLTFTGFTHQTLYNDVEGTFGIIFPQNTGSTARDFSVTLQALYNTASTVTLNFTQVRKNAYIEIVTSPIEVASGSTTLTRTINANIPWTAASPSWVSVYPATGNGDATLTIGVPDNTGATRSGYIYITSELETLSVPISQESGANYILRFTPGNVTDTVHNRWILYWTVRFKYAGDADFTTLSSGSNTSPHNAGAFDTYAPDAASIVYAVPTSAQGQALEVWYNVVTASEDGGTFYYVFNETKTYNIGTPVIVNQNFSVVMPVVEDGVGHYTQNP